MTPGILVDDKAYLVVEKPSGWITNDASTTGSQPVLQTWLRENLDYEISKNNELRSGIVHRLDKETSGVLVVAKTESAFRALQEQFKERVVKKRYTALAHGKVALKEGDIDAPVGRLPWRRDRFGVLPGGRPAFTSYKLKGYYKKDGETLTLLTLFPKTGRTHQIRIHLKHLGNAIVADEFYAGRKTARKDRLWCPRLFLHASGLSFKDPETGKVVEFEAELPKDLKTALATLESTSENI